DPRLGVAERALEQRLHRPALGEEPVLRRLAEPRGERRHRVDIGRRAGDIAELQAPCRAVLVGLDRPLELPGARGDLDQLAGELLAQAERLGKLRRLAVRLLRRRRVALARLRVAEREQQLAAPWGVILAEGLERVAVVRGRILIGELGERTLRAGDRVPGSL